MWKSALVGMLLLVPALLSPGSLAQPLSEAVLRSTIQGVVSSASHPYLLWPDFPDLALHLDGLYGPQSYGPVWLEQGEPRPAVDDALAALRESDRLGLVPADYDAALLTDLHRLLLAGNLDTPDQLALFDTALTIGMMRLLSDVSVGRVQPRTLSFSFDVEYRRLDLAPILRDAVANDRIAETIREEEPRLAQNDRLKQALAFYRKLAADASLEPVMENGTVRPGGEYSDMEALNRRLLATGDLVGSAAEATRLYSGEAVEAVKRFQTRHGLGVDGVLGRNTFRELNTPMSDRVRQIEMSLERLRWLPDIEDGPLIVANIPAFRLFGFREVGAGGGPQLVMNVIVGKSLNKQTPVFHEDMRYLVFRPYWNIPYSITVKEIVPKLRRDPGYLDEHDMEIVERFGADVPTLPVTEDNIALLGAGRLNVRQRPGPNNSLGLVKFIFPNEQNIYLHSTPAEQLFHRTRRDFSHGCIRVEDPVALAEFVLRGAEGWDREAIVRSMNGGSPTRVHLAEPVPVFILYATALVSPRGKVFFYDDIYGHDQALEAALQHGPPYPD